MHVAVVILSLDGTMLDVARKTAYVPARALFRFHGLHTSSIAESQFAARQMLPRRVAVGGEITLARPALVQIAVGSAKRVK